MATRDEIVSSIKTLLAGGVPPSRQWEHDDPKEATARKRATVHVWLEVLAPVNDGELRQAIHAYMGTPGSHPFPMPSELLELVELARRIKAAAEAPPSSSSSPYEETRWNLSPTWARRKALDWTEELADRSPSIWDDPDRYGTLLDEGCRRAHPNAAEAPSFAALPDDDARWFVSQGLFLDGGLDLKHPIERAHAELERRSAAFLEGHGAARSTWDARQEGMAV